MNLDVNSPEKVHEVLLKAAQRFRDDASELTSAHQTRSAGAPWNMIARELEKAAAHIEKQLHQKFGY